MGKDIEHKYMHWKGSRRLFIAAYALLCALFLTACAPPDFPALKEELERRMDALPISPKIMALIIAGILLLLIVILLLVFRKRGRDIPAQKHKKPSQGKAGIPEGLSGGQSPLAGLRITVLDGTYKGDKTSFRFSGTLTIGRDADQGICFSDPSVSPAHARIYEKEGKLYLEDMGSAEGTYLGGMRIFRANPLRDGDEVAVGDAAFIVHISQ